MNREKLTTSIEEIKNYLIDTSNAEDVEEKLERLLSLKGQFDIVPMNFFVEESDITDSFIGDNFRIYISDEYAHFMTTGGYHVFARKTMTSLYSTIKWVLEYMKSSEDGKKDEMNETVVEAIAYVMEAPMFAFCDLGTTLDIATSVVKSLNNMGEILEKEIVEKEDIDANLEFEQGVKTIDKIRNVIPEIESELEKVDIKRKPVRKPSAKKNNNKTDK